MLASRRAVPRRVSAVRVPSPRVPIPRVPIPRVPIPRVTQLLLDSVTPPLSRGNPRTGTATRRAHHRERPRQRPRSLLTQLEIPQAVSSQAVSSVVAPQVVRPPVEPGAVKPSQGRLAALRGCLDKLTGRLVKTTVRVMDSETSSMREGSFVLALLFLIALAWFGA